MLRGRWLSGSELDDIGDECALSAEPIGRHRRPRPDRDVQRSRDARRKHRHPEPPSLDD